MISVKTLLILAHAAAAVAELPTWPIDFTYASSNPGDFNCVDFSFYGKFCSQMDKDDPKFKFSINGHIKGMRCVRLREPHEGIFTYNNYLCVPNNSP